MFFDTETVVSHFRGVQRSGLEMLSLRKVLNLNSVSTLWPWKLNVLAISHFSEHV